MTKKSPIKAPIETAPVPTALPKVGRVMSQETRTKMSLAQQARRDRDAIKKAELKEAQEAEFKERRDRKGKATLAKADARAEDHARGKRGRPAGGKPAAQSATEVEPVPVDVVLTRAQVEEELEWLDRKRIPLECLVEILDFTENGEYEKANSIYRAYTPISSPVLNKPLFALGCSVSSLWKGASAYENQRAFLKAKECAAVQVKAVRDILDQLKAPPIHEGPWHADTHLSAEDKAKWEARKHQFYGVRCKPGTKTMFDALVKSKALSLIGTPVPEGYKLHDVYQGSSDLQVILSQVEEYPVAEKVTQSPYEVPSRRRRCGGMLHPMMHMMMEDIASIKPDIRFDIPLKDIDLSILGLGSDLVNVIDVRIIRCFGDLDISKFYDLVGGNEALTRAAINKGLFDCVSAISREVVTLADLEELTSSHKFFEKFKAHHGL